LTRPSKTPEARAAYWAAYRSKQLPYVQKECTDCARSFSVPAGGSNAQRRCDPCRTAECVVCERRFIADRAGRRCCSRTCVGNLPENRSRIQQVGSRPRPKGTRAHLERDRTKHGSAAEREWRTKVFRRDGWTCQDCGARGVRLQADHIKPWSTHPDLRLDLDNGRTLCEPCHRATSTYGWRGYWLKRRGEAIARRLAQDVLPLGAAS